MLDLVDKTLLRVKTIEFHKTPSIYNSNTTLYGGRGKLGMEKSENLEFIPTILATIVAQSCSPKLTLIMSLEFHVI